MAANGRRHGPAGVTPGPTFALAKAAAFEGAGNPTKPVSIYSTAAANTTLAATAVGPTAAASRTKIVSPISR